jgi:hypothetical protein
VRINCGGKNRNHQVYRTEADFELCCTVIFILYLFSFDLLDGLREARDVIAVDDCYSVPTSF